MHSIESFQQAFAQHIKTVFSGIDFTAEQLRLHLNIDESRQEFGNLTTSIAMVLAKPLTPEMVVVQLTPESVEIEIPARVPATIVLPSTCTASGPVNAGRTGNPLAPEAVFNHVSPLSVEMYIPIATAPTAKVVPFT